MVVRAGTAGTQAGTVPFKITRPAKSRFNLKNGPVLVSHFDWDSAIDMFWKSYLSFADIQLLNTLA